MRWILVLFVLLFPLASQAQVAAITDIYPKTIEIFAKPDGSGKGMPIDRDSVVLPSPQLSHASDYGLISVELHFKDTGKKPLIGWVAEESVKTDAEVKVDVQTSCGKNLSKNAVVTRGTRGLGDRC